MVSGGGQEVARFYAVLGADTSGFTAGVAQAQNTWSRFGQSMLAGVGIGAGFAAVTTAVRALSQGIQSSVGNVMSYETAFTGIRKTVDGTAADFAALDKNIRGLATTLPVGRNELANIGQAAGQLGVRGVENITKFTETIAKISRATNLTSEAAATGFARFANVMGTPIEKIDVLASGVVALGNNMATTESEILDFGSRISGAGRIAGLTEGQVFSLGAALASIGVEAEAGGTAAAQALLTFNETVAKGGKELELLALVSGMTSAQFVKAWKEDAYGAFIAFERGLGKSGDSASVVLDELGLGGVRTGRALLGLAQNTDLLTKALDKYNEGAPGANALNEEFGKFSETTANRIQTFKNNVVELADAIGGPLVGAINDALGPLTTFVQKMQEGLVTSGGWLQLLGNITAAGFDRLIPGDQSSWWNKPAPGTVTTTVDPAWQKVLDEAAAGGVRPGSTDVPMPSGANPWMFEGLGSAEGWAKFAAGAGKQGTQELQTELDKLLKSMDDGTKKMSDAERAEKALAQARENAAQHVEDVMTTRVVEAYIKGGDAAVAAVRTENESLLAEFNGMLPQFKALGLEIPATAIDMFLTIRDGAKQAAAEVVRAFDQLRYGLVSNPSESVQADFEAGAATGQVLARDAAGNQSWFPRGAVPAGYNVLLDPTTLGYAGPQPVAPVAPAPVHDQFGGIPQLAGGGIVMPRSGGTLARLAEAGKPEAVIPLDRMGGVGGEVHFHFHGAVGDQRAVKAWVQQAYEDLKSEGAI